MTCIFPNIFNSKQEMSDYTPSSQFDPRFNEIWDENTSIQEEETKEESQPGLIAIKSTSSDPISILKPQAKTKITISTITAETQSIISAISRSTFRSNSSSLAMTSVLLDSPIDRDLSEITLLPIESRRSFENSLERKFLHLYDSFGGEQAYKMTPCISEEVVFVQNQEHIPTLFTEETDKADEAVDSSKKDHIQADSNQSNLVPVENLPPPGAEQENAECSNHDIGPCESATKSVAHKISIAHKILFNSDGITSIPELLASTASQFLSSSLNVDDEISKVSIYFVAAADEKKVELFDSEEVAETTGAIVTPSVPTLSVTREEKRLDKRNLLDSLLRQVTTEEPQISEASEEPAEDKSVDSMEDENVTEGLGLTLPPVSQASSPQNFEMEDLQDANLSTIIEVDETGKIVIDSSDGSTSTSNGESHHQEVDSSHRDVYISYRIEGYQSDDTVSLSYSQDSESSDTFQSTPQKENSGLKSFSRWGKKFFSGNKDKNNGGAKTIRKKAAKSIYDSPGSVTVKTAAMTAPDETAAMTVRTYATLHFGDDHPVNPRKLTFLRRSRTAKA
jgi:hypothetical protein